MPGCARGRALGAVLAVFMALPGVGRAENGEAAEVICPSAGEAVSLDGRPVEPAWRDAAPIGPLLRIETLTPPDHDGASAKLLHDDTGLYLAVSCRAPDAEPLPQMARDDGRIWRHDHLEVFLDPTPDSDDYFHLLLNRGGSLLDAWHGPEDATPQGVAWNGEWQAAVGETPDGWTAEFAIPFAALGAEPPQPGDLWRFKLGRDGAQDGPTMWPTNPTSSFHARAADGSLYFDTMNLLRNPGFEEGELGDGAPQPWSTSLTSAEVDNRPQGEVHTVEGGLAPGERCLRFRKLATALWWPQVWNSGYRLQPGGTYEFSIMVRGTMPQVNVRATAVVEGNPVKMSEGRFPRKDEFTRQSLAFVVPEGSSEVSVGLSAPAGAAGEVVYDNAMLRRMLSTPDAVAREYSPPDWSADPDPVHGLEALCARAGHKPWDMFWRDGELLTHRVIFKDRRFGTELWLLDDSPCTEFVVTASIWPGWNADCSVLMLPGSRMAGEQAHKGWLCNADFSRLTPKLPGPMPLWDLENPDVYYTHSQGKVERVNFRTGEASVLATWEPVGPERSYGLTRDNRSVFVTDWDGGIWVPYDPAGQDAPYVKVLDCYGYIPDPEGAVRLENLYVATETDRGPMLRILTGVRVYTDTGKTERVIAPIAGHADYLRLFASGRVEFPEWAAPPETKDPDELFDIYNLYPSCSHGHVSYSPDGEYICWDGGCSFYRARDNGDHHDVALSSNGSCYHTCWFYDPRFFVTCVRPYRSNYDRPENGNVLAQVFTDGTWQPVADIKTRFNAYYYGGNFATLSRDATKIHYESSMTGVPKNYIAVAARPQPPRELAWQAEGEAVVLSWSAPPHHREIKGYLIYRSERSGDGYELLTPEPVADTTYRDETIEPGRAHYYVATSIEHCGLESGYSNEAAVRHDPAQVLVVYAEAEEALADLASGDKPGLSLGRDRTQASNWYYVYRTPEAEGGSAGLKANIPADGRYYLWLRARSVEGEPARWLLSVGPPGRPGFPFEVSEQEWQWIRAQDEPVSLTAGPLDLALSTRDAGVQADLICLATDPGFTPRGPRPEDRQPPEAPGNLRVVQVRERCVQLAWDPVADPDLSHYNLYARTKEPLTEPDQRYLIGSPTYCEFIDWGLRGPTTVRIQSTIQMEFGGPVSYHYAVTAVDRRGNESPLSAVVKAAPPRTADPRYKVELAFDAAELEGPFEQAEAEGTHAEQYVMLPGSADAQQVAAAKATWWPTIPEEGKYYLWLRYLPRGAASSRGAAVGQSIKASIFGQPLTTLGGGETDMSVPDSLLQSDAGKREPGDIRTDFWTWARPVGTDLVAVELKAGKQRLTLENLTPEIRYDVLLITNEPSFLPRDGRLRQR